MFSDDLWFWVLVALVVCGSVAGSARYRRLVAAVRARSVERGLVDPGPGRRLEAEAGGFWSDLSWVSILLGLWVALSPWIWGYDDIAGAVATDLVTGFAVVAVALIGVVFPSVLALNVLAGLWLITAPWLVGYGGEGGPVGLSDALAGLIIASVAIADLTSASRRVAPGESGPIGRVRPRA
jgi:hypothetical protein